MPVTLSSALDNLGVIRDATRSEVYAYKTSTNSHTAGNFVTVDFENEVTDTLGEWNTSTGTFTATNAGRYKINVQVELDDPGATAVIKHLYLYKNGTTEVSRVISYQDNRDASNAYSMQLTNEIELNANDYINVRFTCEDDGTTIQSTERSFISISRIS